MEQRVPEIERAKRLIRKLAEKTADRGCTEHEAMEASEKVAQLLEQFDLQLTEVFLAEEKCRQVEVYADDETARSVLSGISRLCSLRHYYRQGSTPPTFVMFGFDRDIELGVWLYEVLMEALGTEWGQFVKDHGYARKKRDAFRMGFGTRVYQRLVELRKHRDMENAARVAASGCKDLVLVRDHLVDEEFEKTGVRLVSGRERRVHDVGAFYQGHAAGGRAPLNIPVNGDVRSMLN